MVASVVAGEMHEVFDRKQQTRRAAVPNPFITAECIGMPQDKVLIASLQYLLPLLQTLHLWL